MAENGENGELPTNGDRDAYDDAADLQGEELLGRIVTREGVLGGKPIIRGYRISVEIVLGLMAAGWTEQELLESYPYLERDDLLACLEFAHRAVAGQSYVPAEEPVTVER